MELGKLDPFLRERLKISKNGQLWPPFEFRKNWVIIRLEKHLPSKLDDNMKIRIRNGMYEQWISSKVLKLIDQIRFPKNKELINQTNNGEKNIIKNDS